MSLSQKELKKNNIKTVICICDRKKTSTDMLIYDCLNIKHHFLDSMDLPHVDMSLIFKQTLKIINERDGNILVHCWAGRSRSASVVTHWLMKKHKMNFDDAYGLLKKKSPKVNMNFGFKSQLKMIRIHGL